MRYYQYAIGVTALGLLLSACSVFEMHNPPADITDHNVVTRTDDTPTPPSPYGSLDNPTTLASANHPTTMTESIGLRSMDSIDKTKLSHSLDKPIGRATTWSNDASDVTYTVVPISKVTINDNPYCRRYNVTMTRGGRSTTVAGTACVDANGGWQSTGG